MFCNLCGNQLNPDSHFCSACGTPIADATSAVLDKENDYAKLKNTSMNQGMLAFVKNWFQNGVGIPIILWLNLIASIIFFGIFIYQTGNIGNWNPSIGYFLLGAIIGLVLGIIENILLGGFIVTILNIDKNLEILANKNISEKKLE